jgi:hypothetical protein
MKGLLGIAPLKRQARGGEGAVLLAQGVLWGFVFSILQGQRQDGPAGKDKEFSLSFNRRIVQFDPFG